MDHGKLTDHNGKSVNFRNVILIMTTNAGAADLVKNAIGFERESREGDDKEAIERMFTPEFRNRLDAIIPFGALPPEVVGKVVDKFIMQLEGQLSDRNVTIELTQVARDWLARRGYDTRMGARPLGRVIQEEIKKPLADHLLFGDLITGGHVAVDVGDGKLTFVITPSKAKKESLDEEHLDDEDHADGANGGASGGEGGKEPATVK